MHSAISKMRKNLARVKIARAIVHRLVAFRNKSKFALADALIPHLYKFALFFRLPLRGVYESRTRIYLRQIKREMQSPTSTPASVKKLSTDAILCIEHAIALNPAFLYGARIATSILMMLGNVGETKKWIKIWQNLKVDLVKKRQIDTLGIRFFSFAPFAKTIGSTAICETYIKASILGALPQTHYIMFVKGGNYDQAVNPHYLNYWRKYIDFIDDPETIAALEPLAEALIASDFDPIEINNNLMFDHSALPFLQSKWDEEGRPPLFDLTHEDIVRGKSELQKLGVPEGAWFVCLHVREGGARGNEPFRQSEISDYFKAIKSITDRGGWVIRMGDKSMSRLAEMERVVDYPHTTSKSGFMDVFLCASARFFIATSSGLYAIAMTFGVPVAMTNMLPTSTTPPSRHDLFLPKLLKYNESGKLLTFPELFSPPVSLGGSDFFYNKVIDVSPIDNTPEELEALVIEMMDRLDGKQKYSSAEEGLQKRFNDMTAEVETVFGLPDVPINARMGQYYLNKHQQLLINA